VAEGEETVADRFRTLSAQLSRAWSVASGNQTLAHRRSDVRFYEEVRVYMAKYDAEERHARGEPVPEEIQRLLHKLVADSTVTGEVVDIYETAGMPKPSLTELGPEFVVKATAGPTHIWRSRRSATCSRGRPLASPGTTSFGSAHFQTA
jgi:type I restriction enzyme, R subunit